MDSTGPGLDLDALRGLRGRRRPSHAPLDRIAAHLRTPTTATWPSPAARTALSFCTWRDESTRPCPWPGSIPAWSGPKLAPTSKSSPRLGSSTSPSSPPSPPPWRSCRPPGRGITTHPLRGCLGSGPSWWSSPQHELTRCSVPASCGESRQESGGRRRGYASRLRREITHACHGCCTTDPTGRPTTEQRARHWRSHPSP